MTNTSKIVEELSAKICEYFNVGEQDIAEDIEQILSAIEPQKCKWCGADWEGAQTFFENQWVSVDERLPEVWETVLVEGGLARYKDGFWYSILDANRQIQWEVSHWMPLPKPPEDK